MIDEIKVHGKILKKFEPIKKIFIDNFKKYGEVGASFAVIINEEYVVDIWGGFVDEEKTKPWLENTITKVYSTNKIMNAICALMLVDQDLLDLDAPVAKYWPEFAQNGKENLPVRNLFSHSAGLPGFAEPIITEDLKNWYKIVGILARQKTWWEPGTKMGYHMTTMYYLLGELVRRISGKSISKFLKDEITDPLNIDYHIMLPKEHRNRFAGMIPVKIEKTNDPLPKIDTKSVLYRVMTNPKDRDNIHANDPMWFDIETRGFGNAKSVAKIGAIVANGGKINGKHFLKMSTIEKSLEEQIYGTDLVLGRKIKYGLGWGLNSKSLDFPNDRTAYWGGAGGSSLTMDVGNKMSIAYVMNKMRNPTREERRLNKFASDIRACRLIEKIYELI
ncbi:MAG: serine hydrolase domain-containing protein [Promethearchaeota archaeon]